jgi:hypothetical protein
VWRVGWLGLGAVGSRGVELCYGIGVASLGRRLTPMGREYPNGETRTLVEEGAGNYLRRKEVLP